MLKRSVYSLSELIIHELAHSRLYFKNQSDFNESFANFVGKVGALQFLQRNFGSHSLELYDAILKNEDDLVYLSWLNTLHDRLEEIYKNVRDDNQKRELKEREIQKAKLSFQRLEFRSRAFRNLEVPEINNALLLMSRRYNRAQTDFEKLYVGLGADWEAFFKELEALRGENRPFDALRKLAARYDLGES
jgi:predicted aminopeptidase